MAAKTIIITHGYQTNSTKSVEWVEEMARGIRKHPDIEIDRIYKLSKGKIEPIAAFSSSSKNNILIPEWIEESNNKFGQSFGFAEAAADAFLAQIISGARKGMWSLEELHFIGHSRGAVVNSEIIQRLIFLADKNLLPDSILLDQNIHMTTLDPHPVGQWTNIPFLGGADDFRVNNFKKPINCPNPGLLDRTMETTQCGVLVWKSKSKDYKVSHADNYWQVQPFLTDGTNPLDGMPSYEGLGAHSSFDLTNYLDSIKLYDNQHSMVHDWYFGSIDSNYKFEEKHDIGFWYPGGRDKMGFNLSLSEDLLKTIATTESRVNVEDDTTFAPDYKRDIYPIFNGSFQFLPTTENNFPGWSLHGGGGPGKMDNTDHLLNLDDGNEQRTHNILYIPSRSQSIIIRYKWAGKIFFGKDLALALDLDNTNLGKVIVGKNKEYNEKAFAIPDGFKGGSATLTLRLVSSAGALKGGVKIDDIHISLSEQLQPTGPQADEITCWHDTIYSIASKYESVSKLYSQMTKAVLGQNDKNQKVLDLIKSCIRIVELKKLSKKKLEELLPDLYTKIFDYTIKDPKDKDIIFKMALELVQPAIDAVANGAGNAPYSSVAGVIVDFTKLVSDTGTLFHITEDTERINEIIIARNYLINYYENNKNETQMAIRAGLPENLKDKEDFIDKWAQKVGYEDNWVPGEEYNTKLLLELIEIMKREVELDFANCFKNLQAKTNECGNKKHASQPPLATAIVLDNSGSMNDEQKVDFARNATFSYPQEMEKDDFLSVSLFSTSGSTPQELNIAKRDEISKNLEPTLRASNPDGGTNIGAGLTEGLNQLCSITSDRAIKTALLLSDGINNTGSYESIVAQYEKNRIPIYTVKFGQDASERNLKDIARKTKGTYWDSSQSTVATVYHDINAGIQGRSTILSSHDLMDPDGDLYYEANISVGANALRINTSWQGSELKTVLTSPSGATYSGDQLPEKSDRFESGAITQSTQIKRPEPGLWKINMSWKEPPTTPERVNLLVSEHADTFTSILGFSPEYSPNDTVTVNIQAAELDRGNDKIPLKNVKVKAKVLIPGDNIIRVITAQSQNLRVYDNVILDNSREIELFDDGEHDDYDANDGIFGGNFNETQLEGSYIVTADIEGLKTDGSLVKRHSTRSFQVGSIFNTQANTNEIMQYARKMAEEMSTKVVSPLGNMNNTGAKQQLGSAPRKKPSLKKSRSLMDQLSQ